MKNYKDMTPERIKQSLQDALPKVKALQKRIKEAAARAMSRKPIVLD